MPSTRNLLSQLSSASISIFQGSVLTFFFVQYRKCNLTGGFQSPQTGNAEQEESPATTNGADASGPAVRGCALLASTELFTEQKIFQILARDSKGEATPSLFSFLYLLLIIFVLQVRVYRRMHPKPLKPAQSREPRREREPPIYCQASRDAPFFQA